MHGVHDLGGMDGFGPVQAEPESAEPVFHAPWEGRVYGMVRSLGPPRQVEHRHGPPRPRAPGARPVPPKLLLRELVRRTLHQLVEAGLVTPEELASGRASEPAPDALRGLVLRPGEVAGVPLAGPDYNRPASSPPRFKPGDRVRALVRRPRGHTREPRYVHGRAGVVHEHYGAHVFADLSAEGVDEGHHLYSVRFDARELWGDSADPTSVVYVDLFEDYLEPESPLPSAGEG